MAKKTAKRSQIVSSTVWGVILASGQPSDFAADIEPAFLTVGSKPVLAYSLSAFERCPDVDGLVLVSSKERLESLRAMVHLFGCNKVKAIVSAPPARTAAVQVGVDVAIENGAGHIVVHDGTRPGVSTELISETIRVARKSGASAVANPIMDPVSETAKGAKITKLVSGDLWTTATPQAFKTDVLHKALVNAVKKKLKLPDEAAAATAIKQVVHLVPARRPLIRIASPAHLSLAEFLLRS